MIVDNAFDYVVIGGGSAGCVLASRLSENTGMRIALEAGASDGPESMSSAESIDAVWVAGGLGIHHHAPDGG